LIIIGEEGCNVIPEIKTAPEIIADDETFNLLECVSSNDCAHLGMGIVGVGVLAAGNSHPLFIHDIVITFFVSSSTYLFRYSWAAVFMRWLMEVCFSLAKRCRLYFTGLSIMMQVCMNVGPSLLFTDIFSIRLFYARIIRRYVFYT